VLIQAGAETPARGPLTAQSRLVLALCAASFILAGSLPSVAFAEPSSPQCRERAEVRAQLQSAANPASPYRERVESYKRAISTCPEDPSSYSGLAELLLAQYQFNEALRWIQQGLKVHPNDTALSLDRAGAYLLLEQPREVLSALRGLPPSAKGEFYRGLAYRNLKDPRAAQDALRQAWKLGYHDPFLLYALAEQDRILKDYERFSEDLLTLRAQFPNSAWSYMAAGDNLKAQQKLTEAKMEYEKAEKLNPNLPFLNHRLGDIAYNRADYPLAVSYFRKEIALNPAYPAPYVFLGLCLHRQGKNSEALPYLEEALARAPEAPLAYLELALVQTDLNQLDRALATLESARTRFPDMSAFPAKLARLLSRLGRPEEAKVQAALAQQLGEKHVEKEQELLGTDANVNRFGR
jgi:tetratricopeptide (TPR) repeat protein